MQFKDQEYLNLKIKNIFNCKRYTILKFKMMPKKLAIYYLNIELINIEIFELSFECQITL